YLSSAHPLLHSFPTRRSSDLATLRSMRVGVVDLGTNSTRLLVADVDDGNVDEVARELTITRLGEGVDERRKLLPLPMTRVRNVRSEEHTSELQSRSDLVCRLL